MNWIVLIVWSGIFLLGLSIGLLVNVNTEQPCSLSCSIPDPTWDPTLGNFLMPEAEGHLVEVPPMGEFGFKEILHTLNHILEEEKKQTELLDHIDCLETTKYFHKFIVKEFKDYPSSCGQEPLNMTGLWKR